MQKISSKWKYKPWLKKYLPYLFSATPKDLERVMNDPDISYLGQMVKERVRFLEILKDKKCLR